MLGYSLVGEEHSPRALVRHAVLAEEAGFEFAFVSDHYHPWCEAQGHSPHVWSLLGALSQVTRRMHLGTAVTCPGIRNHPVLVAQAAATCAILAENRFFLGVGTGEHLNEHVTGRGWPAFPERLAMLAESIEVIRLLWRGEACSHRGRFYSADRARVYDLPSKPPPIYMAASGPGAAAAAAKLADGLIGLGADAPVVSAYRRGGTGPCFTQLSVCWAPRMDQALETVCRLWPVIALPGTLYVDLATPADFEAATRLIRPEDVAASLVYGPDPLPYVQAIRECHRAGFEHVSVHPIGPDQEGFFRFWLEEVRPGLSDL
ncbi:MAG: TIGR03557 family F420-dependent LLM class oxidoreductase [Armatimonadetes bacterium]|nr:TIGR03557 family F420-dependent LLM class oxidoreductase [Armatimonadota bacterium]